MCARRFLILIFILTLMVVAAAFAMFQFGSSALTKMATPKAISPPPPPRSGPDYAARLDGSPRPGDWPDAPLALGRPTGAVSDHGRDSARARPSSSTPPPTSSATAGTPRSTTPPAATAPHCSCAARPARSTRSPTCGRRATARRRSAPSCSTATTPPRRSTSLIATSHGRSTPSSPPARRTPDHPRRAQPGRAASVAAAARQGRRQAASRGASSRPMSSAGRCRSRADLPAMGLAACNAPDQASCILSWQSFGDPANTKLVTDAYEKPALAGGGHRRREDLLCTNPVSGLIDGAAAAAANLGTLVPSSDLSSATLAPGQVGARCEQGFLIINGNIPDLGPYVLPGNNYHVYDYALFWGSIRADAARRLAAFAQMIHLAAADFAAVVERAARRARRRHQDDRAGDLRRDVELRHPVGHHPPHQVRRRPRPAARLHRPPCAVGTGGRPAAQPRRQRFAAHPVGARLRPQPRCRSTCRSCCGTNAGRPSRSNGR